MRDIGYPFHIELGYVAVSMTTEDAVRRLPIIADHLGLSVVTELNGTRIFASPGDDPHAVVARWRQLSGSN